MRDQVDFLLVDKHSFLRVETFFLLGVVRYGQSIYVCNILAIFQEKGEG